MEVNMIIRFLDGHSERGELMRPFRPKESEVEIKLDRNEKVRTFNLDEICCLLFVGTPTEVLAFESEHEVQEEVETTTGERFHVLVIGKEKYDMGFFGIPLDPQSKYRKIFFSQAGVRERCEDRPLGDILEENGLISHETITQVVEEQKDLREKRIGDILADRNNLDRDVIEQTLLSAEKNSPFSKTIRVGDILISSGLVTREQVEEAFSSQIEGKKKRIGDLLVEKKLITEEQLLMALATKFKMRYVDLKNVTPSQGALAALSTDIVERLRVFPIEFESDVVVVATSQPTDPNIGDMLRFHTDNRIELVASPSKQIDAAIEKFFAGMDTSVEDLIGEMSDDTISVTEDELDDSQLKDSDSSVIKLVNKILFDAFKKGVSDVHFEPGLGREVLLVRYRLDGICHVAHNIPSHYKNAIVSRIKIMSKLDISERRRPQSGKILLQFDKTKAEFRVEITPTAGGNEDAVLRILTASKPLGLSQMGFSHTNLKNIHDLLKKPYGIALVVGPTGSGKTTTLHSYLQTINVPERKIWTAEDPVEITQPGLRQVQVHAKIGFTFQQAMRSFLRADPDVIMIGEMRDPETAKIAIEASLTGHLVFSTLHTNSATETVVRLIDMGMDPYNFSDALLGILAQRLVRRLCICRTPTELNETRRQELLHHYGDDHYSEDFNDTDSEEESLFQPNGCDKCSKTGFKGRLGIHELLMGTNELKLAIKNDASAADMQTLAIREGMRTLKMDGIQKTLKGKTTLEQVLAVCI